MADPVYHALIEACGKPGCPVCRLALRAVRLYLDNLLYENVNDYGVRSYLRRSLGFCNLHAWQLLETGHGNAMGIAMIYHDILSNVLKRLPDSHHETQPEPGLFSWLRHFRGQAVAQMEAVVQALRPRAPCPACRQRDQSVRQALEILADTAQEPAMIEALQASAGLCLPHFSQVCERAQNTSRLNNLLASNRKNLAALDAELVELIRKYDYRFIAEGFGEEGNAWKRVIPKVSGEQDYGC